MTGEILSIGGPLAAGAARFGAVAKRKKIQYRWGLRKHLRCERSVSI
jgi:hypothetical protein